jgi:hypothetical protein
MAVGVVPVEMELPVELVQLLVMVVLVFQIVFWGLIIIGAVAVVALDIRDLAVPAVLAVAVEVDVIKIVLELDLEDLHHQDQIYLLEKQDLFPPQLQVPPELVEMVE